MPDLRPGTRDTEWIPLVAEAGWLIATRDSRIQDRRAEIIAVREAGAKMIRARWQGCTGTWQQLEALLTQWRAIDTAAGGPGPFIFSALRSGLRGIELD